MMIILRKIYRRLLRTIDGVWFAIKNAHHTGMKVATMRVALAINPTMYDYKHRTITEYLSQKMSDFILRHKTQDTRRRIL